MGRVEAEQDGIEYYYDPKRASHGHHGAYVFKIPCSVCGNITTTVTYGRNKNYVCGACKRKRVQHKQEIEKAWFEVIEEKGEARFNKALDEIEKQVGRKRFSKYERAVKIARTAQDKYGSVPEAMVAVELIKCGYSIIPQKKVGRYRVDFYIPKKKIVVEVDGKIFHQDRFGGDREAKIQLMLGLDVKIIHVPAELIAKDIKKLDKIIKLQEP